MDSPQTDDEGRVTRMRVRLVGDDLPGWVGDVVAAAGHRIEPTRPGDDDAAEQVDVAIVDARAPDARANGDHVTAATTRLVVRRRSDSDVIEASSSTEVTHPFTEAGLAAALDRAWRFPVLLLVDDDPDSLLLQRVNAEFVGWRVVVAADGVEGLEQAERWRPDVIVLNVMMPRLDGWQTLKRLRDRDHTATTPVLMCTSKVQDPDIVRGYHLGCDDYVRKPFSPIGMTWSVALQLGRVHGDDGPRALWPDDPVAALRWLRAREPLLAVPDDDPEGLRVEPVPGAGDGPAHLVGGCTADDGRPDDGPGATVTILELVKLRPSLPLLDAVGDEEAPGPVCPDCLRALLESRPPLDVRQGLPLLWAQSLVVGATALRLLEEACDRFDRGELQSFEQVPWAAFTERRRGPLGGALGDARRELTWRLLSRSPHWMMLRHAPGTVDPWQHPRLAAGLAPVTPPREVPHEETVEVRLEALRQMTEADDPWVPVMLRQYPYRVGEGPLGKRPLLAGDGWLVEEVPAGLVDDAGWGNHVLPLRPNWTEDELTVQKVRRTGRFWTAPRQQRTTVQQAWVRTNNS